MKKTFVLVFMLAFLFPFFFTKNIEAYGFGYKKNDNHEIPDIGIYKDIIEKNNGHYIGDPNKIYLTFDVGYDNGYLDYYLDVLKQEKVTATFFVTGDFCKRFEDKLMNIYKDGHLICNHSYSHSNITKMSENQIYDDLKKLETLYYDKIGSKMTKIFRPPEGQFDEKSMEILKKLGYKTIFWSIAHVDWKQNNNDAFKNVLKNLHGGAIILLHTVNKNNYECLSNIINEIRNQGYEFSTVDKIM